MQKNKYSFDHAGNITNIFNDVTPFGAFIGGYNNKYKYDGLHRLIWSDGDNMLGQYDMEMQYSPSGRIAHKQYTLPARALSHPVDMYYGYCDKTQPHAVRRIYDHHEEGEFNKYYDFRRDKAGNLGQISIATADAHFDHGRFLFWTEDNRLYTVADERYYSYYAYDHTGQRTLKMTGDASTVDVNAWEQHTYGCLDHVTLYPSPYMVLTEQGYTKHHFEEGRRICSKIGGGMRGNVTVQEIDNRVGELASSYDEQYHSQNDGIRQTFHDCIGADPQIIDGVNLHQMLVDREVRRDEEEPAFFYHSDHLGSAAYLTYHGGVIQTLNYLPYGEDWVERNYFAPHDTTRLGIYRFNGKEKDYESGFHYYGARYYWSEILTGWLSVDPLADKYPSISPYAYCAWNPVKLVDPDGRDGRVIIHNEGEQKTITIQTTIYLTTDSPKVYSRSKLNNLAKNYNYWAKRELTPKTINGVTVQFDVTYKVLDKSTKLEPGDNVMSLNPNTPGRSGTPCKSDYHVETRTLMEQTTGSYSNINMDDLLPGRYKGVLHETGHLLGLSDRYLGYNTSFEGFEKDLMGWNPGFSSDLDETHYQNYIDYFGNQEMGTSPYILLDKKIDIEYTNKLINHAKNPAPEIQ